MKELFKEELLPGMVLGEDIYNFSDQLVVSRGTVLTDYVIAKLEFYSVFRVKILEDVFEEVQEHEPIPTRTSETKEFKEFKKKYDNDVHDFKESLNDIVEKNVKVDIEIMYQKMQDTINNANGLNIMDMIHNLRQYDDCTYAHAVNVALICNVLAGWLRFSQEDIKIATMCGLLHDIGKLKMPSEIIKKPGKLTNAEYSLIKQHSVEGYNILKEQKLDLHIQYSALMHHEKCDGSGYPCGLSRNQIDHFAKLVAIADVYDAMTAKRVFRGPICPFEVIRIFEEEGIHRYEAPYIMTFMERVADTYVNSNVLLTDGREGKIAFINKMQISAPMIQCGNEIVDLSRERNIKVLQVI